MVVTALVATAAAAAAAAAAKGTAERERMQQQHFGLPVALTPGDLGWYHAPSIDGYTSITGGSILSPWKRGLNFTLSTDYGNSWRAVQLPLPGRSHGGSEEGENYTTIVQGGFVRTATVTAPPADNDAAGVTETGVANPAIRYASQVGHTLGTLPTWCTTCVTPSPGLCDARASALCPGLACNQTYSPLTIQVNWSPSTGLYLAKECRQVGIRGLPRRLRPEFGLASGFTGPSGPVKLADGSFVMVWPVKFADSP
eukprot:COSAG01_NODE_19414_length_1010_cov_3.795829_1_plen_254_part_10